MRKTTVAMPDPDEPQYNVLYITPQLAEKWLRQNTHNRNLRERVVNGYATDMRDGNWVEDGQSIKFAKGDVLLLDSPPIRGGALLDGQHRLSAIVTADVTVRMLVVSNLPDTTQDTMDTGAKRSLGDVLKLRGEDHYVTLAAALLRVYVWKQGARKNLKTAGRSRPTHRQLLRVLDEHPELRRSAEMASRVRNSVRLSASTGALCHWLFNRVDASDCAFFFARLTDHAGLVPGDPIYALRRVIENLAKATGRPDEALITALVIKAWNFYRAGEEIQTLAFKAGGAKPETYPEPK
ncbi:hypothetical protein [Streptomyces sp. NBC_00829]|uniref:hypothetical protein n=1 Tax=Streptomyces sp. NBC_00829 TaxID=2903679 RepID=UPI0038702F87|nr:hypothetical protein OG293_23305 [Streptomyces sp. NBC_00829]